MTPDLRDDLDALRAKHPAPCVLFTSPLGRCTCVMTPATLDPVPNQPKTPRRTLRISDELWEKSKKRADERGETVSEAVRKFLERYSR